MGGKINCGSQTQSLLPRHGGVFRAGDPPRYLGGCQLLVCAGSGSIRWPNAGSCRGEADLDLCRAQNPGWPVLSGLGLVGDSPATGPPRYLGGYQRLVCECNGSIRWPNAGSCRREADLDLCRAQNPGWPVLSGLSLVWNLPAADPPRYLGGYQRLVCECNGSIRPSSSGRALIPLNLLPCSALLALGFWVRTARRGCPPLIVPKVPLFPNKISTLSQGPGLGQHDGARPPGRENRAGKTGIMKAGFTGPEDDS